MTGDLVTDGLMREVGRLRLRARRRVDDLFAGEYRSAFKGRGVEFDEVRDYTPGDDVRAIDWNVTARAGRPFIKRFVEERELTLVLAVDASASGDYGSAGRHKRRVLAEIAAVMAVAAARNRDKVGLALFAGRVELFLPPAKGPTHTLRVMRELVGFSPASRGTDLAAALEFLGRVVRRRAIVMILSDFRSATPADRPLAVLARRHDVIAVRVADPRERSLPAAGLVELEDPETGDLYLVDTGPRRRRAAFADRARRDDEAFRHVVDRAGAGRIEVSTDRPFMPDLVRHFKARELRR